MIAIEAIEVARKINCVAKKFVMSVAIIFHSSLNFNLLMLRLTFSVFDP